MIEALGNLGDLLSGVGVVITLVYLAIQIRQNTIATRTDSYQAAITSASEWSREVAASSELSELLIRGMADYEGLTPHERLRFTLAFSSYFRNMENIHAKFESGAIDFEVWEGWANRTLSFMRTPGTRAWWAANASAFSRSFQRFLAEPPGDVVLPEVIHPAARED